MIDFEVLNGLLDTYRARDMDVAQAFVEQWDDRDGVEVEANKARDAWLRAVLAAWPELRAEVAALRQQLDEARGGLRAAAENVLARRAELDAAEADNARLLDVYRAAEAWAGVIRLLVEIDGDHLSQPTRDLLTAVDAYHAWTEAKPGDTPGELVPGEGEQQQPMWCGTDCIEPRHEPNWDQDFLDFPTAWWIQEQGFGHTDERCSAVQSNGALLCDCGAVEADWKRLRAEQRPAEAPDGERA